MKKMKRLFAALLILIMVLGMTTTAFAEPDEAHKPSNGDKATATVTNVEAGATVTAYRIVGPTYNELGFTGYQAVEGVTLGDVHKPTSDEVTNIAANKALLAILEKAALNPTEADPTTYTADLGAGYWIVIVENTGNIEEIYNPMLVGIYYRVDGTWDNNTLVSGEVSADDNWNLGTEDGYAKSEPPKVDKKITGSTLKDESDGNESGNDVAVGDTVHFEIDTQIPSYSESYSEVVVKIKDKLGEGLTLADPANLVVKVGGTADEAAVIEEGADTFTYTPDADNKGFTISFASAFALAHSGEKVYVTYDAVLGEDAVINFDPNTNEATFEYTNTPGGETNEVKDKTYTYTFGINADVNGESQDKTQDVIKVDANGKEEIIEGETVTTYPPLGGATFSLTRANKAEDGTYTPIVGEGAQTLTDTTGADGKFSFTGLDAGYYILKETEPPEGYSLNDEEHYVEIQAEYNEDGTLKSYSIKIDGEETSKYTLTHTKDEESGGTNTGIEGGSKPIYIKNTKLTDLPSTGGIGTTIFTIAGCVIMVAAAVLFFATRRKSAK